MNWRILAPMKHVYAILLPVVLAACGVPVSETVSGRAQGEWVLESVNDAPARAVLTIRFAEDGTLEGSGPCNRFSARQTAPLPWFELAEISVTERACAVLAEEAALLDLLVRMAFAEIAGDTLLLTGGQGESLLFRQAVAAL